MESRGKRDLLLYLGVPFCPQQCRYCRKRSVEALPGLRKRYATALRREIEFSAPDFSDCTVPAVWVGGGIPGHMFDEELGKLLRDMPSLFDMQGDPEITLKVHPGMVSIETVNSCRRGRVTRLSVEYATGSTFEHRELGRFLGTKAMDISKMVLANTDFVLSFDIMVGAPGQTQATLHQSLDAALLYGATHISIHPFELISGTELWKDRQANGGKYQMNPHRRLPSPSERDGFLADVDEYLVRQGFACYLPNHYALPGAECRYRLLEARGEDVLGFGLGAETLFRGARSVNTDDMATYLGHSDDPERCIARI